MSDQNLFAQQASNRRKSAWLVAGFLLFCAWIGFGGDLAFYFLTREEPPRAYHHVVPWIGLIVCTVAGFMVRHAWLHGADRVLAATGAAELIHPGTPAQQQLVNVVEEMAIAAGIRRPGIWIIPENDPNAFATGRDPAHAHIAVTEGLLALLDREELQGVISHEMSHIRNYDIRLMTLLASIVGAVALMSEVLGRGLGRGGLRRGRVGGKGKSGAIGLILLVAWLLTLVLAPLVTMILTMSVSRRREYLADATGAQLTRNPGGLARALRKIEGAEGATTAIARGTAHLCIVDPGKASLSSREGFFSDLFASHPPMHRRLSRLDAMGYLVPGTPAESPVHG